MDWGSDPAARLVPRPPSSTSRSASRRTAYSTPASAQRRSPSRSPLRPRVSQPACGYSSPVSACGRRTSIAAGRSPLGQQAGQSLGGVPVAGIGVWAEELDPGQPEPHPLRILTRAVTWWCQRSAGKSHCTDGPDDPGVDMLWRAGLNGASLEYVT